MRDMRIRTVCPECDAMNSTHKNKESGVWSCYKCGWKGDHPKKEMRTCGKGRKGLITTPDKGEEFRAAYDELFNLPPVIALTNAEMKRKIEERHDYVSRTYGLNDNVGLDTFLILPDPAEAELTTITTIHPSASAPLSHGSKELDIIK